MMAKSIASRVYSATYSNIPVYEFQFGEGLKEHVMRRRGDNWINATHILKAAGLDKPTRTRILEREVQKEKHEKIQGGYGKYQGTWVPLEQGEALAQRNNIFERLRPIFEYTPGDESPPAAPKHSTAKPKASRRTAVSKTNNRTLPAPSRNLDDEYENISTQLENESVADDTTVASFMDLDDERYEVAPNSTGYGKRKRATISPHEQAHILYSDELLDYFMLSSDSVGHVKPEPPFNFNPDWIIDNEGHTALHWAAAMGDVQIINELKHYGATLGFQNCRGETPLMRCVQFVNCQDKKTMPGVVRDLIETVDSVDFCNATALHHAAAVTISRQKHSCARYYLDVILNMVQEVYNPQFSSTIINSQDVEGNTALHIAAKHGARKCIRALIGRNALTNIKNNEGMTAEDLIRELNEVRREDRRARASSSPYGYVKDVRFGRIIPDEPPRVIHHASEAAMSIQSKIAPQLQERIFSLAAAFDEELEDKESSEREARRILSATTTESEALGQQLDDINGMQEDSYAKVHSLEKLNEFQRTLACVVERQQSIQLFNLSQQKEANISTEESRADDFDERVKLAKQLDEQQKRRQKLVQSYIDAHSMAGAGEKSELYRRVLIKSLGSDVSLVDQNLDALVEQLKEDVHSQQTELMKTGSM
ncbi:BgTH12-06119 [Blumeria graminis f. sp. triticale]|nr:BgTH12-06119 [Blumeria graminis f. sp. triticale]